MPDEAQRLKRYRDEATKCSWVFDLIKYTQSKICFNVEKVKDDAVKDFYDFKRSKDETLREAADRLKHLHNMLVVRGKQPEKSKLELGDFLWIRANPTDDEQTELKRMKTSGGQDFYEVQIGDDGCDVIVWNKDFDELYKAFSKISHLGPQ